MRKSWIKAVGLFLLLGVCTGAWAYAPAGVAVQLNRLVASWSVSEKSSWQSRLMWRRPISSEPKKVRTLKEVTFDWLSGEEERREMAALGHYLFNMYLFSAAQGYVPEKLDLNFIGVLDPLENISGGYEPDEMKHLYFLEKEKIQERLGFLFEKKLGLAYQVNDPENNQREEQFLQVLQNSSFGGRKAFYVMSKRSLFSAQNTEALTHALQKELASCIDDASVCTYEQIDAMDMLNRKSGTARRDYFYRPLRQECDACAYTYCKSACLKPEQDYAGWILDGLYRVYARPAKKEFLTPATGNVFSSAEGQNYPPWNYHAAALFRLKKDGQYTLLVQDPFLFEEPVPLTVWAEQFAAKDSLFYTSAFQRREKIEKQFVQLTSQQLESLHQGKPVKIDGIDYHPYPVRSAE